MISSGHKSSPDRHLLAKLWMLQAYASLAGHLSVLDFYALSELAAGQSKTLHERFYLEIDLDCLSIVRDFTT